MPERKLTGGTKEFSYKKEDLDKIRSTDTQSTHAFKKAYDAWNAKSGERKLERELQMQRKKLVVVLLFVIVLLLILLVFRFL